MTMVTKKENPPVVSSKQKDSLKKISLRHILPELTVLALLVLMSWGFWKQVPSWLNTAFKHATPTPTPTATPAPPAGTIYIKIPAKDIEQLDSFSAEMISMGPVEAEMVLVVKQTVTDADGSTVVHYQSGIFCVTLIAFLDKNDGRLPGYDENKVRKVLIALKTGDLALYGQMDPDKHKIYLVPENASTCQGRLN
jgi:hypothetical protein